MSQTADTMAVLSMRLASQAELTPFLTLLLDGAIELVQALRGFVVLSQPDGSHTYPVARGQDRVDLTLRDFIVSQTVIDKVLAGGEAALEFDAADNPKLKDASSVRIYQLRSLLCVPLKDEEALRGVLYLDNDQKTGAFTADDLHTLEELAQHARAPLSRLLQEAEA